MSLIMHSYQMPNFTYLQWQTWFGVGGRHSTKVTSHPAAPNSMLGIPEKNDLSTLQRFINSTALLNGHCRSKWCCCCYLVPVDSSTINDDLIIGSSGNKLFYKFRTELEAALGDPVKGPRILGLHFVGQRISADDVRIHRPQNDFKVTGSILSILAPQKTPSNASFEIKLQLLLMLIWKRNNNSRCILWPLDSITMKG